MCDRPFEREFEMRGGALYVLLLIAGAFTSTVDSSFANAELNFTLSTLSPSE